PLHRRVATRRPFVFRITRDRDRQTTVLRLEGSLTEDRVDLLDRLCAPLAVAPSLLGFDLSDLMFADEAGVACLSRLIGRGAVVRGGSPFVNGLLRGFEQ